MSPMPAHNLDDDAQAKSLGPVQPTKAAIAAHVRDWTDRYRLTAAETVILRMAVSDTTTQRKIAAKRRVSHYTVKNQVHVLLNKILVVDTGDDTRNLDRAVAKFYRELLEQILAARSAA